MHATEFDIWVKTERTTLQQNLQNPDALETALIARLREEKETYDQTIGSVVYAWRQYEAKLNQEAENPNQLQDALQSNTARLINELLTVLNHRPLLVARLQSIKASLLLEYNGLEQAAELFSQSVSMLTDLHQEVDLNRIYNMTILGQVQLRLNKKPEAEKIFLDVLSYPWYLVRETDVQISLREYYITAAIGLIECRRGDLPALKNIFFVPATEYELKPILDEAIREASSNR